MFFPGGCVYSSMNNINATRYVGFVLAFLMISTCVYSKVVIRGKIIGYDGQGFIAHNSTMDGVYAPYSRKIKPAANGIFEIAFRSDGFGVTRLVYKGMTYRFFHDRDSEIYLEFRELRKEQNKRLIPGSHIFEFYDSIKQVNTLRITGDYESVNRFYNSNLRSSFFTTQMVDGNPYSLLLFQSATPTHAMSMLDSLIQRETDQIDRLPRIARVESPAIEDKENQVRSFLYAEVQAFYRAVFLNAMFLKRSDQIRMIIKDSTAALTKYNTDWEKLIEALAANAKFNSHPIPQSPDYVEFIESLGYTMNNYKNYYFPTGENWDLDQEIVARVLAYDTTLIRDAGSRKAYELSGLHRYLNDQLYYSPFLLNTAKILEQRYATSQHLQFYKALEQKLEASLKSASADFREARMIRGSFNSWDELVATFKGKNLLVDIWATWCHPCIEEFKNKNAYQEYVSNGELEVLYISVDQKKWAPRWEQGIRYNELRGYHYRADEQFIVDMWKQIGGIEGAIPRYVLIDKDGNIFRSTAPRPGNRNDFDKELRSLITAGVQK